jgi:hypothetical protein
MDHQRLAGRGRTVVAGEVDQFGGNNARFSGLEQTASLPFDFDDQAAFDDIQQFLRTGMHVPGSSGGGREFDDAGEVS